MAIIDFVKWNGSVDLLAWKYPMGSSEELSTWTQLVVNESQEAFLVKGGVYEGPFGAGRHTLSTENIPILRKLIGLPFGGSSPFSAEVWFVNKAINLDVKWGTPDPIQLQDPKFNLMVPVRAFGQYGIRIQDSKKFLLKLVGTVQSFDKETLATYFRGYFITKIKTEIANAIIQQRQSVLVMGTQLEMLSAALKTALAPEMEGYGVALEQFNVTSINLPEDDPAVQTLKSALAKRAEMEIVGFDYKQERSFDVLQTAAGNEGTMGGMMGAGLGLGMGVGIGAPMGQAAADLARNLSTSHPAAPGGDAGGLSRSPPLTTREKIELIRELEELRSRGVLTDAEFQSEKRAVMGSDQQ
jgi:membrane protease subunit (stomatin/prohibitin family)